MSHVCPNCATRFDHSARNCPDCGAAVKPGQYATLAPIRRLSGKLQAVGVILTAISVIAVVTGYWWGAALLFPSVVVFLMGRLL